MRLASFVAFVLLMFDQNVPVRDRAAAPVATGTVRGKVTSSSTGDPLHRVQVTLIGAPTRPAVTDTRGEFEIAGVPPGRYTIAARRSGYLAVQYGQRGPGQPGRPITVAPQATERIDFSLVRGGTLAGTISDDVGSEAPGVRVEAIEFKYVRGRRIPVQAAVAITNDLGQFRLSGLPPGPYLLRAATMETWTSDDGRISYAFAPTYYPGVTALGESETVTLNTSQEIASLNFGLRVGRAARITGVFHTAGGQPAGGQAIGLELITRTVGNAVQSSGVAGSTRTDREGTFEFRNLAPGEYVVWTGSDTDRSTVTVILAEGDERSVTLSPQQPIAVTGAIVVAGDRPASFAPTGLRVTTVPADPDYLPPNTFLTGVATVTREWTFRYSNLVGPYLFRIDGLPDDWLLARVTANGRDVSDIPLAIGPGREAIGPLQITITSHTATLSGTVMNADGQATADATVVAFAADRSRWSIASRFIKAGRPEADGKFTISGLAPGRYLAIARESIMDGEWEAPAFLSEHAGSATPFEARAGETSTVALRLERVR